MKRMVDPQAQININSEFDSRIEALEDAPAGSKLYLHYILLSYTDEEELIDFTTKIRIVCSKSEAFASFSEFLSWATSKPNSLDRLPVVDDAGEGVEKLKFITSNTEYAMYIAGGNEWHTEERPTPTFTDTVTEL